MTIEEGRIETKGRKVELEILKGIGIILVVIGHNVNDQTFIFCFHMPLFFLISGFLFSPKTPNRYLKRSFLRLLIPYVCFLFIVSLPDIIIIISKGDYSELKSLILRDAIGGEILKGAYAVFWYVTVLWMSTNLFNLLLSLHLKSYWLPILIGIAYLTCLIPHSLPWNIQVVPMATSYIWIGYILKSQVNIIKKLYNSNKILYTLIAVIVLTLLYFCRKDLTLDMKYNNMGVPLLSLISSVVASLSVAILSLFFTRWNIITKILVYVGGASMVVMYLHMPIKHYITPRLSYGNLEVLNIVLGIGISLFAYELFKANRFGKRYFLGEV
ncbi:MAG: acyltransferase family protein [Muribaculaceae bacterium]|nr:acyltransferase family protein [Muribaculaceae bacterium]